MHEQVRDDQRLLASVSVLFQPTDTQTSHPRPTELMHRAWSLLEAFPPHEWPDLRQPVLLQDGQRNIAHFRSQWQILCDQTNDPHADVARELLSRFTRCPSDEFIAACGNHQVPYIFRMGSEDDHDAHDDEQPQHSVRISPFQMMNTPVTREQFALFDSNHEREYQKDLARYSPSLDCPAIYVSWYDAWCFAR